MPIETIVHAKQKEYYQVLALAGKKADSTEFIEFMLENISEAVDELPAKKFTDIIPDKITDKLNKAELEFLKNIIGFLENNQVIDNYRAQALTNKSADSVKKHFAALVEVGILKATGEKKGRKYSLMRLKNS